MLKGDKIFTIMLAILLFFAGLTVYHNYRLDQNLRPSRPRIDPEILSRQLESRNLSLKKADFFRVLGETGRQSPLPPDPDQNPWDEKETLPSNR